MVPQFARLTSVVCAAAFALGCAGSKTSAGAQPSWRKGDAAPARTTEPQRIVFAPQGAAVLAYNQPPFAEPTSTKIGDAIVGLVGTLSTELGKTVPVSDGRLFAAAHDLAVVSPDEGTVAYRMIEFAMQRHGIIEPSPHLIVMRAGDADHDTILAELGVRLDSILSESDFARVGVGVAPRKDDSVIVLALQTSAISTEPIPRKLPKGAKAPLRGTVSAPFRDPHIYITHEDGDVETVPLQIGADGVFSTEVDCAGHHGRQQVEITASDHTGSTVLANFPVWCDETPPTSITVEINADGADSFASASAAEERMVELINDDRRAHGLPPVAIDSRVGAVSRAHSKDMLETGFVGHVSPNTGSASDRVVAADIKSAVVLENVARAYGLGEAQDGLMNSPGHRANILSKSATHVGVGIVLGKMVSDRREMFITQVFIAIPEDVDRDAALAKVSKVLRAERPLRDDVTLSEIAQQFSDDLAAGQSPKDAAARASLRLHKLKLPYRGVTTLATTLADIESFDAADALKDRSISHFGIGIAQGDHPELGENAISIVVLFGHQ